jgi:hypothetical protein
MKAITLLSLALFSAATALAQPSPVPPRPPHTPQPPQPPMMGGQVAPKASTANYSITVSWKEAGVATNSLRVLTSEGSFQLDTLQGSKRIDQSDIPTTVSFTGTLDLLDGDKARLKLFLGRTVPYVTGTHSSGAGATSSSYQQLRVGLNSTFTVTFGKPLIVQADQTGEVTVLVKREDN